MVIWSLSVREEEGGGAEQKGWNGMGTYMKINVYYGKRNIMSNKSKWMGRER
jgi:hypothetical protein